MPAATLGGAIGHNRGARRALVAAIMTALDDRHDVTARRGRSGARRASDCDAASLGRLRHAWDTAALACHVIATQTAADQAECAWSRLRLWRQGRVLSRADRRSLGALH
jgi:hypothetical protein